KAYILHRDSYACQNCKATKVALHVHHIKFRSEGGSDTPDNLVTLCHPCHAALHDGRLDKTISEKLFKKIAPKTKHATEIGIVSSQIKKIWAFTEAFAYETKFNRENLALPKTHYNDAVAIGLVDNQMIEPSNIVYFKKHVSMGDYQQTSGARSEKTIPTGKFFGLRKFDLIGTSKGVGFVKGKRSSGYFALMLIDGNCTP
ncbi:MAG: HNH endonuclease, partial [Bdellovibrionia bacterium]